MIFSDNKLTSDKILVRFYKWLDWERGYGDAGTALYINLPLDLFKEKEEKGYGDIPYFTYRLTEEGYELMKDYGYSRMSQGYELANPKKREEEIAAAKEALEVAENTYDIN